MMNEFENILFIDVDELKKDSYLDDNVTDNTIRVAVLYAQDTVVERIVGTCLADHLKTLIGNNEICNPDNSHFRDLLDNYLFQVMTYLVQAEISVPLTFKTRNAGMISNNDNTYQQTALKDMIYINQFYLNKADFYMQRAINYLKCNKELFPQLQCSQNGCGCTTQALQNPAGNSRINIQNNIQNNFQNKFRG